PTVSSCGRQHTGVAKLASRAFRAICLHGVCALVCVNPATFRPDQVQHGPWRMTRIDLPPQPNGSKVQWSYLPRQFHEQSIEEILGRLRAFVPTGDFPLGKPVREFEERFARLIGTRHAVGVNSGTDALKLSLKALGVGPGDEVVTAANTFIATIGAIA